ncbi:MULTISPECIES: flippase-like domain-containing protein [unclassified Inquilinus]|jgi:putative membrane protein|uniref:flippase-like domain-containing protein n=1 Tax=unclassified Inquilinus TaxID=2645927 RepID=UPI003F90BABB
MKWPACIGIAVGLTVAVVLVWLTGAAEIWSALVGAGWGILAVIALHFPQFLFSSLGWRALVPGRPVPPLSFFMRLRWIREAINSLLPVAQIGGELITARLLAMRGVPLNRSGAAIVVDLTTQMASQVVFTMFGLGLLFLGNHDGAMTPWIIAGCGIGFLLVALFIGAQRFGMFKVLERALIRLADKFGWSSLGEVSGLHDSIVALYEEHARRVWVSGGHHLISWLLGCLEIWMTLWALGVDAGFREAVIIESLAQAIRMAGVIVPGALGVQEGGFIVICGLLGIPPHSAVAMALIRRIREIALGVPGLVAWQIMEGKHLARRRARARATSEASS